MSGAPPSTTCLSALPLKMLVRISRHSRIGEPEGCAAMLALLETGRRLRVQLHAVLSHQHLSDAKFAALISLYALEPTPATPSELAMEAQVSRATMTATLESMREEGWVTRECAPADRRMRHVQLTDSGRLLTEETVLPFLAAMTDHGKALTTSQCRTLHQLCATLCEQLPAVSS
ncbi:MAG: MarR family transcriptional regulator [Opitutaceae bacterium]|jgi:DNA-binding MarR family transcriptional regulator